jgi:DNA-binding NarL/FixJ family response regulator
MLASVVAGGSTVAGAPDRGPTGVKLLVVDGKAEDVRLVGKILAADARGMAFEIDSVGSLAASLRHLSRTAVEVVLLDPRLPDAPEGDAVRQIASAFPNLPVVVLTAKGDDAAGLAAIREGAQDYLVKESLGASRLIEALTYAVERRRTHRDAVRTALDHFPVGVVLLSEDRRVFLVNRAAAEILAEDDGLRLHDQSLRGRTAQETKKLQDLIAEAASPAAQSAPPRGLSIARRRGRALSVMAAPNRAADPKGGRRKASVVLFVCDSDRQMDASEAVLQPLYGLSPAEARVAWGLMQGKSLEEICTQAGVSINTGRSQLKRVLEKTGTRRQGELIRLLLSGPAPLRLMQVLLALMARAVIVSF